MNIEIQDVHFAYSGGVEALRGVSMTISTAERVAIVGQNGAGKTTLVKQINGLLKPTSGRVLVGGRDTSSLSVASLATNVGYVFQNPDTQLFSTTVEDEVKFGPRNLGFESERLDHWVDLSLELTGLQDRRQVNPYDLSPSWRKMVAFASIIAMDTEIVILDEPTTGQDAVIINLIAKVIDTLSSQGKTLITITHDIDFAAQYFTRLVAMVNGRILLDGTIREVVAQDEALATTFVDPPQITRLGKGLGYPQTALNQDEFLNMYSQALAGKQQTG